jgi:hypothetical protein
VTAGSGFGLAVTAEDGFGNVATSYNTGVILVLASNPASATLGGTVTVAPSGGVATFSGLSLNKAATGDTLRASSGGLLTATTTSINVSAAAATHLVVTTQPPAAATAGAGFGLVVTAEDDFGNTDPTYQASVGLALAGNSAGGTLGGTRSVTASAGVAAFSGLTLDKAGGGPRAAR